MEATLDSRGMNNRDELVTDRWTLPTAPVTRTEPRVGGGGTWVFFGWGCAARDSKLAPRSKKNFAQN